MKDVMTTKNIIEYPATSATHMLSIRFPALSELECASSASRLHLPCQAQARSQPRREFHDSVVGHLGRPKRPEEAFDGFQHRTLKIKDTRAAGRELKTVPDKKRAAAAVSQV